MPGTTEGQLYSYPVGFQLLSVKFAFNCICSACVITNFCFFSKNHSLVLSFENWPKKEKTMEEEEAKSVPVKQQLRSEPQAMGEDTGEK